MRWEDKRIIITGVTGFIGSALAEQLIKKGADIYGLIRISSTEHLNPIPKNVNLVKGDLRYEEDVKKIFEMAEPEIVFHLGAFTHVGDSFKHRRECWDINYSGTVNMIEEATKHNIERFIFAGTSEEYGNQENFPINEKSPLKPESPYACSKVATDLYCQMMWKAYKFPVTILRPFNTFGRKHDRRFVVEKIIHGHLTGGPILMGDSRPTRDFNYINNIIDGYVQVSENSKTKGEALNMGSGKETSIKNLVELISKLCNKKVKVKWNSFPPRPNETWRLCCDSSKMKQLIGWESKISLEDGLKNVIDVWRNKINI